LPLKPYKWLSKQDSRHHSYRHPSWLTQESHLFPFLRLLPVCYYFILFLSFLSVLVLFLITQVCLWFAFKVSFVSLFHSSVSSCFSFVSVFWICIYLEVFSAWCVNVCSSAYFEMRDLQLGNFDWTIKQTLLRLNKILFLWFSFYSVFLPPTFFISKAV
jgi:hypothetical protein